MMFDQEGFVLCGPDVPPPPFPWSIVKSTKYPDRWFFHNSETNESVWRLPPWQDIMTNKPDVLENRWTGHVFTPLQPVTSPRYDNDQESNHMDQLYNENYDEKERLSLQATQEAEELENYILGGSGDKVSIFSDEASRAACREMKVTSETASISTDGSSSMGSLGSFDNAFSNMLLGGATQGIPQQGNGSSFDSPNVPPLKVIGGLGMGGFAVVVSVEHLLSRERFAMKVIAKETATRPRDRMRIVQELHILRELPPCPFISRCHYAFESLSSIFFVMDLCSGGDLFYHLEMSTLQGRAGLGEDISRMILAETASGLIHMHTNNIVHRDIKVENIMLDRYGHAKIIDFGLTKKLKGEIGSFSPTGSLIYMAPELLHAKVGGRFTDWWAFGVVAHELLTGRSPWSSLSDKVIIRKEIQTLPIIFPSRLSPSATEMLSGLLERQPAERLGSAHCHQVMSCSFFETIDFNALWRGELPGVPIPDKICVRQEDNQAALLHYQSRPPVLNNPGLGWALGVDHISMHPV